MNKSEKLCFTQKLKLFFATGFLVGYFPFASGTVGSFLAILIYLFIPGFEEPYIMIFFVLLFIVIGIFTSDYAEKIYGFDPPEVVIDEIVGMWFSLLFLPKTYLIASIGFILFRIFDIIKPFPAKQSQNLKGGIGIMLDDIIAGFYSLIIIHLILLIFPEVKSL
ncbi:MAG: phosphatidylglycerophosphatase A [Ignavibacteria bacterium]|nr:phosphatidylglycerophosphatase A [Ignavibacteria bacterium]